MSIKYSIAQMRNPLRPEEAKKFYAKAQVREVINLVRISEEIAWGTTLTDGDVMNVIRSLGAKIAQHLADGDMVELGELGKFQCQLSSNGSPTFEEFTHLNITKVRFQFRPGRLIRKALQDLKFERVISLKVKKEAKKQQ